MKREAFGVEIEVRSVKQRQEDVERCERCRRAYEHWPLDGSYELRCYDDPSEARLFHPTSDNYRVIKSEDCESCAEFDPIGLRFPLEVEDVLIEDPELGTTLGCKTGAMVAVRPCNPDFGKKTYLGYMVGEMPRQIGLKYDGDAKELIVAIGFSNPMILIPELNAVVYGYESWWHKVDSADELRQITDDDIMSQPYMTALAKLAGLDVDGPEARD